MNSLWSVWAYVASFGTIGTVLLLAVFAPSVLGVLAEWAKPIAAKLGELIALGIHWLINILRVGVPHIAQSFHAVILVALLAGSVWVYKDFTQPVVDTPATCQSTIKKLRKDFQFVPRKNSGPSITKPSSWFDWW
jgi:hypothetical protein